METGSLVPVCGSPSYYHCFAQPCGLDPDLGRTNVPEELFETLNEVLE